MLALTEVKWSVFFSLNFACLAFFRSFRFLPIIVVAFGRVYVFEQLFSFKVGSNHFAFSCSDVRRSLLIILRARFNCGLDNRPPERVARALGDARRIPSGARDAPAARSTTSP